MEMIDLDKTYFSQIQRLPLVPIRNRKHLKVANKVVRDLALKGDARAHGESEYLTVLSQLVSEYESREFVHLRKQMTQGEILDSLLESSGMSQNQFGKIVGMPQARLSDVITGKRKLSKDQIARLCQHFNLSADLFLFAPNTVPVKIVR
jgi:antitoxin component HigA of HigAB toxin-antitoxin module